MPRPQPAASCRTSPASRRSMPPRRWETDPKFGEIWYPGGIAADWTPYRDGVWRFLAPWGWTWIDNAAWGFAPSHYGRWARIGERWGWVPGPQLTAADYSAATVAFLGTAGIGLSRPGDAGSAIAWFPLAPGESDRRRRRRERGVQEPSLWDRGARVPLLPPGSRCGRPGSTMCLQRRFADAPVILGALDISPANPAARRRGAEEARPRSSLLPSRETGRRRAAGDHATAVRRAASRRSGDARHAQAAARRTRQSSMRSRPSASTSALRSPHNRAHLADYRRLAEGVTPARGDALMIDYRSDNTGRAAPQILDALVRANSGTALGYGGDEWTARLQERFSELFETRVRVFPVATGTAANALSLAAISPSWGLVFCSAAAHINTSEANAAGFFGGGLKLAPVAGPDGKVDAEELARALAAFSPGQLHRGQPSAVNLTQASDLGAVYRLDEVRAVGDVAKARGLKVHMDGARFANAVLARLQCSPAELRPWRAGVDIMSFGATKNGGALCDAIVVFNPELADGLAIQLRRAGQVWSKMRFASAQLMAYIENGLWLHLAAQSNAAAARIAAGIANIPGLKLLAPVEANELFPRVAKLGVDGRARSRRLPVLSPQRDARPLRVPL